MGSTTMPTLSCKRPIFMSLFSLLHYSDNYGCHIPVPVTFLTGIRPILYQLLPEFAMIAMLIVLKYQEQRTNQYD